MTIAEALKTGLQTLESFSDAPDLDAQRLLLHSLSQTESSWLYAHAKNELTPSEKQGFLAAVAERKTGQPLAYILGFTEFYGRRFIVGPEVLIPRPLTEDLVKEAIEAIKGLYTHLQRPLRLADVGTGSGCIAITLALECPEYIESIMAIDISPTALKIAQKNAEQLSAKNIIFKQADLLADLNPAEIDVIVSNPPYIPSAELDQPETIETAGLKFEPHLALDGGVDGQNIIKRLTKLNRPMILEVTGGVIKKWALS